ncbi:MAG: hypothetical protein IPN22_11880 [Bacteroidetes bacterium]|nr:hypothetical protein [Bacteroidota bacterium]
MKKEEVPQDPSVLDKFTKEVCYAVDEKGEYTTTLSRGWQVKADALGITWQDVEARVEEARQQIKNGARSPIAYFMEVNMMDLAMVSAYTGFWQWTIKRHLKPDVFKNLSDKKLQKYADAFQISLQELKNF